MRKSLCLIPLAVLALAACSHSNNGGTGGPFSTSSGGGSSGVSGSSGSSSSGVTSSSGSSSGVTSSSGSSSSGVTSSSGSSSGGVSSEELSTFVLALIATDTTATATPTDLTTVTLIDTPAEEACAYDSLFLPPSVCPGS